MKRYIDTNIQHFQQTSEYNYRNIRNIREIQILSNSLSNILSLSGDAALLHWAWHGILRRERSSSNYILNREQYGRRNDITCVRLSAAAADA